ncbi:MAG: leucine-rich repeat domain-containing protein [Promethearchaeota archaeon]
MGQDDIKLEHEQIVLDVFRGVALRAEEKQNMIALEEETGLMIYKALSEHYCTRGFIPRQGWINELGISEHKLDRIPETIFKFKHLRRLRFILCELDNIDPRLWDMKKLVDLSLEMNNLKELPEDISKLENLMFLRIHDNKIEKLPSGLKNLKKLKLLKISYNPIKKIPKYLSELKSLKHLIVDEEQYKLMDDDLKEKLKDNGCEISIE